MIVTNAQYLRYKIESYAEERYLPYMSVINRTWYVHTESILTYHVPPLSYTCANPDILRPVGHCDGFDWVAYQAVRDPAAPCHVVDYTITR